jgi:hypothetical protein
MLPTDSRIHPRVRGPQRIRADLAEAIAIAGAIRHRPLRDELLRVLETMPDPDVRAELAASAGLSIVCLDVTRALEGLLQVGGDPGRDLSLICDAQARLQRAVATLEESRRRETDR